MTAAHCLHISTTSFKDKILSNKCNRTRYKLFSDRSIYIPYKCITRFSSSIFSSRKLFFFFIRLSFDFDQFFFPIYRNKWHGVDCREYSCIYIKRHIVTLILSRSLTILVTAVHECLNGIEWRKTKNYFSLKHTYFMVR